MGAHDSAVDVFFSLNDRIQTTIHSLRRLLCPRFVLGSVLGAEAIRLQKAQSLPSRSLESSGKDRLANRPTLIH